MEPLVTELGERKGLLTLFWGLKGGVSVSALDLGYVSV